MRTDGTAVIEIDRLAPDTEYFYRGVTADGAPGPIGKFRTAPARAKPFRFAWSGGMDAARRPFALLDAVTAFEPDFFLMLGDTIFADPATERVLPSLGYYRAKHRENRADAALQRMLATTPVYAMWDDGEAEPGVDRTHPALTPARGAFREYWPVRAGGFLYRRFAWTPAVDVFLLDCRSYRSPIGDRDLLMCTRQDQPSSIRFSSSVSPMPLSEISCESCPIIEESEVDTPFSQACTGERRNDVGLAHSV